MASAAGQLRLPCRRPLGAQPAEALPLPSAALRARCNRLPAAQRPCAVAAKSSQSSRRRAEGSSTELAASSTSVDEPALASTDEQQPPHSHPNGSMGGSLLASIDEAYHSVSASVHDAEVAVETVLQQSLPVQLWRKYTGALQTNPVRTKAITSFVGFVLGDVMAQKIGGVSVVDPLRCVRLGTYGLLIDGPAGHLWYRVLDKSVCPETPNSLKAVLLKTAADQLIWAPIMTCVFFAVLKTLEGHPELILATVQDKLIKTIVANYILWPGAHFINFRFVPSEHRILYNNCVSVVWNAYLSTLSHDAAVVDTTQLLGLLDQAQSLLDAWVPPELADTLSSAFGGSSDGLKGLRFDIPRSIDLKPTRTLLDFLPYMSEEKGI